MISTSTTTTTTTTEEAQTELFVVGRKRRRQRKRSRKKTQVKVNVETASSLNEAVLQEDVEEYLVAVSTGTTTTAAPDEFTDGKTKDEGDSEAKQCGCQATAPNDTPEFMKRRRRRHRSRNKRKGHVLDQQMNEIEADAVEYIREECYRFSTPDFVAPAFKVHERCEHPNYTSHSPREEQSSDAQVTALDGVCKSNGKLGISKRKAKKTSIKTKAQLEEAKAVEKQNRKLKQLQHRNGNTLLGPVTPAAVQSVTEMSDPVNSIEELSNGDIFYFNQLILKDSEPVVQLTKAKLFMKMLSPGENKPNVLLFRPFSKFEALNSETWWCSEDEELSPEPFIIKFEDISQVRKHVGLGTAAN